jgi:hypothetical protein
MVRKVCIMDLETQYIGSDFSDPKVLRSEGTLGLIGILVPTPTSIQTYYWSPDENQCGASTNLKHMVKFLLKFNRIVGFNSVGFDNPCIEGVINREFPEKADSLAGSLRRRSFDMNILLRQMGCFSGLDNICQTISDFGKTEDSSQIPHMWKRGEHQKVRNYLERDLRMTLFMYNYALLKGKIKHTMGLNSRYYIGTKWFQERAVRVNFAREYILEANGNQYKRKKKSKKEVYLPPYSDLNFIFPKHAKKGKAHV